MHDVVSTDLIDRGFGLAGVDFLLETTPRAKHIVTNPPYNCAEAFVARGVKHADGEGKRHDSLCLVRVG